MLGQGRLGYDAVEDYFGKIIGLICRHRLDSVSARFYTITIVLMTI